MLQPVVIFSSWNTLSTLSTGNEPSYQNQHSPPPPQFNGFIKSHSQRWTHMSMEGILPILPVLINEEAAEPPEVEWEADDELVEE